MAKEHDGGLHAQCAQQFHGAIVIEFRNAARRRGRQHVLQHDRAEACRYAREQRGRVRGGQRLEDARRLRRVRPKERERE